LIFRKNLNIIILGYRTAQTKKINRKISAACHNRTYATYLTIIVFIVEGIISRLNKNPNAYSGRSKKRGYACEMVKRRRQLIKEGYKFNSKTREWIKK